MASVLVLHFIFKHLQKGSPIIRVLGVVPELFANVVNSFNSRERMVHVDLRYFPWLLERRRYHAP